MERLTTAAGRFFVVRAFFALGRGPRGNLFAMASLARCPRCDTFVKPASIEAGTCPFCPADNVASRRNPIPGLVLAAAVAATSCKGGSGDGKDGPVYGIAPVDAGGVDAAPPDADPNAPDAGDSPIYGIAPESE